MQLAKPLLHTGVVHEPPTHDDAALATAQLFPQTPQLPSVVKGVSQPGWALQSPKPSLQVNLQPLFTHEAFELGDEQPIPHIPQLFGSLAVFTQAEPHLVGVDAAQSETHVGLPVELEQSGVGLLHIVPQAPQWSGVLTTVSQPGAPSQSPKPLLHTGVVHLVPSHDEVALVKEQESLQRAQLDAVPSGVSHPGWLLQSPKPVLHVPITH
ncbi:MAG TPA: hypothetical protein VGJ26_12100 [Pirellulales bacterium]